MAGQGVFIPVSQPPGEITFVVTTQHDLGEQALRHSSTVYTHVANHAHARRRRSLVKEDGATSMARASASTRGKANQEHAGGHRSKQQSPDNSIEEKDKEVVRRHSLPVNRSPPDTFDEPLLSGIDPFLQLPVAMSAREKSYFNYYLTEGRHLVPGSSTNPAHCIALRMARDWLQYSPLLANHILMHCEFMFSEMAGQPLPPAYYRRRMQAFSLVRQALASPDATFSYKLLAVMSVVWMAYVMHWPDAQAHLNAMSLMLEPTDHGQNLKAREVEGPTLRPQWLLGMFLVNEFRIAKHSDLCTAKSGFLTQLERIQEWTTKTVAPASLDLFHKSSVPQGDTPDRLTLFLLEPIEANRLSSDFPFGVAAAPFFCCYSICATFVEKDMQLAEAWEFLRCVQRKLVMIDKGCSNGGKALSHMMGDARLETSTLGEQEEHVLEVRICRSAINALKIYSLLSSTTRIQLTKLLYEAALMLPETPGSSSVAMQAVSTACEADIGESWRRQQA